MLLALLLAGVAAPAARADTGPPLTVDPGLVRAALSCPDGFTHDARPIVLLVHGTGTTAAETWPEGLGRTLPLAGFDWCMVQLPDRALGDIQDSSEYVVGAVRDLVARTGRHVHLIGHSQGAVEIRWAVRFWPDVRESVDDLITFAGANNGTDTASFSCSLGYCAPAIWQMRVGAALQAALNREPAPPGPSYTAIYSNTDELVRPASAATFEGASNVLIQDVCPGRYASHAYMVFDAPAVAIALDALEHPGPAERARVPRKSCEQVAGPGIDPVASLTATSILGANGFLAIMTHETVPAEPPLRAYATEGSGAPAEPGTAAAPPAPREPPGGAATGAASSRLALAGARTRRNGAVDLLVRVPGAGTLRARDARQHGSARFRRATRRPAAAGTLVVRLRPTAAGRRLLARRGFFTVRARITFASSSAPAGKLSPKVRFGLR